MYTLILRCTHVDVVTINALVVCSRCLLTEKLSTSWNEMQFRQQVAVTKLIGQDYYQRHRSQNRYRI